MHFLRAKIARTHYATAVAFYGYNLSTGLIIGPELWSMATISKVCYCRLMSTALAYPVNDALHPCAANDNAPFYSIFEEPKRRSRFGATLYLISQIKCGRSAYETGQYAGRNIEIEYSNKNRPLWIHDKNAAGEYDMTGKRRSFHDNRGNVTSIGALRLVNDMTNRPIQMFGKSTGTNGSDGKRFYGQTHTYDAHQRRIKTVEGSASTVRYNVFDAAGMLVQVYDASTNIRTDYVSGPNGGLARIKRIAGVDEVSFIHADWCIFCVAKIARLGTGRVGTAWGGRKSGRTGTRHLERA